MKLFQVELLIVGEQELQDIVHKEMPQRMDVMHGVQPHIWSEVRVNLQMEVIQEV